ncbi:MAG TPA: energy-coupling factor ABC transporter permease [Candidatus Limnocylindria bacterium]|nr:energy-coupling factor ABC transporter permease [Candidatus Limnocylindria bacterium]
MPAAISIPLSDALRSWELHTPDGFLTLPVSLAMWAVTAVVLVLAVRFTNRAIDERMVPLLGVTAAFIFAAQMVNFPVYPGTSGHLLGGVLAAVLLGPWAGTVVMACVVGVQALLFTDGGLVVMGANIFNMGIVGTLGGYAIYRSLARALGGEERGRLPAAAVAAWIAVMGGALGIALQLGLSGATDLAVALPVILGLHALIGLGEAAITVAALAFIGNVRGELLQLRHASGSGPQA